MIELNQLNDSIADQIADMSTDDLRSILHAAECPVPSLAPARLSMLLGDELLVSIVTSLVGTVYAGRIQFLRAEVAESN